MRRIVLGLLFLLVLPISEVGSIQILENEARNAGGRRVRHTLTVGITSAQLSLGPIAGFFVNVALFPFIGPSPEIKLIEIVLPNRETVVGTIAPNGVSATVVLNDLITAPVDITAIVEIEFDETTPAGTVATYDFSSLDNVLDPIETVQFTSGAPSFPIPTLSPTGLLLLIVAVMVGGALVLFRH